MKLFRPTPFKLGIAIAVAFSVLKLFSGMGLGPGLLDRLEWVVYDSYYRIQGRVDPGDKVVIVAADEKSMSAFGQWPWPRRVHAEIIDRLRDTGVSVIGLDIVFSEEDAGDKECRALANPDSACDNDQRLADSIRKAPVICGYLIFRPDELAGLKPEYYLGDEKNILPSSIGSVEKAGVRRGLFMRMPGLKTSILPIAGACRTNASFGGTVDEDGIIRSNPLVWELRGHMYPSLSLAVAGLGMGMPASLIAGTDELMASEGKMIELSLGPRDVPLSDYYALAFIRFYGPAKSFRTLSAVDVHKGVVKPEDLKGRFVMYGSTTSGIADFKATPVDPILPGVELHATLVQNMLDGYYMTRPNMAKGLEVLLILLGGIALSLLLSSVRLGIAVPATFGAMAAWQYASYALFFKRGIWTQTAFLWIEVLALVLCVVLYRYHQAKRAG
ncbi:MAG: CHASE2 domain-containing protein [Deltaproteobacteria bacterium]|nr:CHASE2 domain-containing protein [Deltaproteobacteria bacterium]